MSGICDCELSHNGLGMTGRECDCPARHADPTTPAETHDFIAVTITGRDGNKRMAVCDRSTGTIYEQRPTTPEAQAGSEISDDAIAQAIAAYENVYEGSLHIGAIFWTDNKPVAMRAALEAFVARHPLPNATNSDARLSLRDTFIAEKGLWSEFAETVLHQQSSLEASGE